MGTGSFPGVKRPGHGADHPPSYSAKVKERVSYTLLHLLAFMACYGSTFTFTFTLHILKTKFYYGDLHEK